MIIDPKLPMQTRQVSMETVLVMSVIPVPMINGMILMEMAYVKIMIIALNYQILIKPMKIWIGLVMCVIIVFLKLVQL